MEGDKMSKILFKFPTRGRPVWFLKTLHLWLHLMSGKYDCDFLIAMDVDDPTMNNDLIRDCIAQMDDSYSRAKVDYYYKKHDGLVDAINTAISSRDFDIVMCISDDVIPTQANYDIRLVECMEESWPELDGAIYFYDGNRKSSYWVTIPIMGKALYRERGYFLDPYYKSGCADRDLTIVLRGTDKLKYYGDVLFRHTWKMYGGDNTYANAKYGRRKDWERYVARRATGYYKPYMEALKESKKCQ